MKCVPLETVVASVAPEELFSQLTLVSSGWKSLKEKTLGEGFSTSRPDNSLL